MADNSTCRKMTTLWNWDVFKLEMLKSVESPRKIKQNSAQFLAYVRHKCGALATREMARRTVGFRCISLSKLPHSLFLIPGALRVHSVFSWWVIWKRLGAPVDWDWEPSLPILFAQCFFLILLEDPKPQRQFVTWASGELPEAWTLWVHQDPFLPEDTSAEFSLYGTWHQDPI